MLLSGFDGFQICRVKPFALKMIKFENLAIKSI